MRVDGTAIEIGLLPTNFWLLPEGVMLMPAFVVAMPINPCDTALVV
jgi:hypothetical protein